MANDFYIDPATDDWSLEGGTTIRMCNTYEELTRQRIQINLEMFRGEWFADKNYGVPYFGRIYGKGNKNAADAIFKGTIRNTEGVIKLTRFISTLDKVERKYTLVFSVLTTEGEITDIEVEV